LEKAIEKEMKNVAAAFKFLAYGEMILIGDQKIPLHFVFDVKMDFTHKACLMSLL
jgi:hypothetical protein